MKINNYTIIKDKGIWRILEYPWHWALRRRDLISTVNYLILTEHNIPIRYGKKGFTHRLSSY